MKFTIDGHLIDLNGRFSNWDAIAVKKAADLELRDYWAGIGNLSAMALTAAVWVQLKRDEPKLRLEDVEFDCSIAALEFFDDDDTPLEIALDDVGDPLLAEDGRTQLFRRVTDGELVNPKAQQSRRRASVGGGGTA